MNPVARAVAWRNLQRYALDATIKLYVLAEGEDCEDWAMPLARYLTMVLVAVDYDKRTAEWRTDVATIERGVKAFQVISQHRWAFLQGWVPAIEAAIETAVRLTPKVTPQAVNYAWQRTH